MKILFLTNNNNTVNLQNWLIEQKQDLVVLTDKVYIEDIKRTTPDLVISYNYKYMISQDIINAMKENIINLHVSYLPWNKGSNPNIWSIVEDTPKGVTIHYVDEHLDTGKIICQKKVHFEETDTLKSSYEKLQLEIQELFKKAFKQYDFWRVQARVYNEKGTYHTTKDFNKIKPLITSWDMSLSELKEKYKKWKDQQ